MLAEEQVRLFEALKYCAVSDQLGVVGKRTFGVHSIDEVVQEDTSQVIVEIMSALGMKASPVLGFRPTSVQSAVYNQQPVYRIVHQDNFDTDLSASGALLPQEKQQRNNVTLQDWCNTYFDGVIPQNLVGDKTWKREELPEQLQVSAPAEQQLQTSARQYLNVDTRQWSTCQLTLGVTGVAKMEGFARQAVLNPTSQIVKIPVLDENNQFRTAVLKLKAVGLQRSASGAGGGHYLLASMGKDHEDWSIQDDDRSMPYENWRDALNHGAGADPVSRWMDFKDLLNVGKYTPATCLFDVVRYE